LQIRLQLRFHGGVEHGDSFIFNASRKKKTPELASRPFGPAGGSAPDRVKVWVNVWLKLCSDQSASA